MIPLHLRISGFLSYRDPADLDFTAFELACISGANGAGKSTLLDAMTWALFGQARRRDESLINLQSDACEVVFDFRYEDADYRILRSLRRGRSGTVEFQIKPVQDGPLGHPKAEEIAWKPLTERTQRETQARIEQVLRLDYDTFVNASFFLQGKADLFAQQSPTRRKEVLGLILGMERWESYRSRTAESRRLREATLASVTGRLGEIEAELSEETRRTQRLAELEADLTRMMRTRKAQGAALEGARQAHAVLERQRLVLAEQTSALEGFRADVAGLQSRLADRQQVRNQSTSLTQRAAEIESAHTMWLAARAELERWDIAARRFQEHQGRRTPLLQQITAEEARLSQVRRDLVTRGHLMDERAAAAHTLEADQRKAAAAMAEAEQAVQERDRLRAELAQARESLAERSAENKGLKVKMDELKLRIDTLEASSGAACPLCGQALTVEHRQATLEKLQLEGRQLGDQYRLNNAQMQGDKASSTELETRLASLTSVDDERLTRSQALAQITERLNGLQLELQEWEAAGRQQLAEHARMLDAGDFAPQARAQLAALDKDLAGLGYEASSHDAARLRESTLRSAEQSQAALLAARAALEPLENEIRSLELQITERAAALAIQESQVGQAEAELKSLGADLPDLADAERALFELQEQENRLNQEVGAARQKVAVLKDLRIRSLELASARQSLAVEIGRHRMLENAFGKDGVPALLIEQALPEVEAHANDILDRLSDGRMSVHFETQAAYKDRKRDDLRETLDIKISDGAGARPYEMYSGGEAFRVNFAIRLALSQVLAGRKGARLQTLIIDEGFGSQDSQGIQRMIETINVIRPDFAKILLISHLEELKDAFPSRIEVEKTERGSVLRVS